MALRWGRSIIGVTDLRDTQRSHHSVIVGAPVHGSYPRLPHQQRPFTWAHGAASTNNSPADRGVPHDYQGAQTSFGPNDPTIAGIGAALGNIAKGLVAHVVGPVGGLALRSAGPATRSPSTVVSAPDVPITINPDTAFATASHDPYTGKVGDDLSSAEAALAEAHAANIAGDYNRAINAAETADAIGRDLAGRAAEMANRDAEALGRGGDSSQGVDSGGLGADRGGTGGMTGGDMGY